MTSLMEAIHELGGSDIDVWDSELDFGVAWCEPDPEDEDLDAQAFRRLASGIEFVREYDYTAVMGFPYRWFIADISGFVRDHIELFRSLAESFGIQVCGDLDDDTEVGVRIVNALVSGYADDETYRLLLDAFPEGMS